MVFACAAVIGSADELTGQAVYAFVTLKPYVPLSLRSSDPAHPSPFSLPLSSPLVPPRPAPPRARSEFKYDPTDDPALAKELTLQVRKVIGPFAAPKRVLVVGDLPKTRSGKIMRRVLRKIVAGEGDQLGDLSTLAEPGVVDVIMEKVRADGA